MNNSGYRLRLGLFVLTAFGILAALVFVFGSLPGGFGPHSVYSFRFADAPGVSIGTPVRKSGVKIGEVRKISLDGETGHVVAEAILDSKYTPRIGEEPTITRGLLGNDTTIDLVSIRKDRPGDPIPPGTEIVGASVQAGNPVAAVQDLMPEVQKSLEQIRRSMQKLEDIVPKVNSTLDEFSLLAKDARAMMPDLKETLRTTGPEITKTTKAIQDAAGDARALLKNANTRVDDIGELIKRNEPKIQKVLDNAAVTLDNLANLFNDDSRKAIGDLLNNFNEVAKNLQKTAAATDDFFRETKKTVVKVNETLTNADSAITDIRGIMKPIGEKIGPVMENVDVAAKQLALTLTDTRELLRTLARADGTVAKLLNDPAFYNNLNEASIQFMKVMPRVDRMFRDLEVFADKIARHPESIGVGGALRPSAGLKEIPRP